MFRSAWRDFQPTLDAIIQKIKLQKELTDVDRRPTHYAQPRIDEIRPQLDAYRRKRLDIEQRFKEQEQERRAKERKEVFNWLTPEDNCTQMHEDHCSQRRLYTGTGQWILKKDKVDNWLLADETPPTHSLLWIHAKKGVGTQSSIDPSPRASRLLPQAKQY